MPASAIRRLHCNPPVALAHGTGSEKHTLPQWFYKFGTPVHRLLYCLPPSYPGRRAMKIRAAAAAARNEEQAAEDFAAQADTAIEFARRTCS